MFAAEVFVEFEEEVVEVDELLYHQFETASAPSEIPFPAAEAPLTMTSPAALDTFAISDPATFEALTTVSPTTPAP